MNAAATPMYLLDRRRRVTLFNAGCEQLTGWLAVDVLGNHCDYTSPDDGEPLEKTLSSLCPPQSVFEGNPAAVASFIAHKDGHTTAKLLHHFPLLSRDEKIDRVLTFALPMHTMPPSIEVSAAQKLHAELASLRSELRSRFGFSSVISDAEAMHRVFRQTKLAAESNAAVHFIGENGTGKQHLARVAHNESASRAMSFVPLNCAALSAIELTRTLRRMFDKDPDAGSRPPHLKVGTLFLKSVQRLPRDVQELLAGNWDSNDPDFPQRLMTSSDRGVTELVRSEKMVSRLGAICGTLEISVPPLRARGADLRPLAQYFLERTNQHRQKQVDGFDDAALAELVKYHWPGNAGELKLVVDEASENCETSLIHPADLPARFRSGMDARRSSPRRTLQQTELEPLLFQVEHDHIEAVLAACNHNRAEAARLLGITRQRLYRRMEQLGISATD